MGVLRVSPLALRALRPHGHACLLLRAACRARAGHRRVARRNARASRGNAPPPRCMEHACAARNPTGVVAQWSRERESRARGPGFEASRRPFCCIASRCEKGRHRVGERRVGAFRRGTSRAEGTEWEHTHAPCLDCRCIPVLPATAPGGKAPVASHRIASEPKRHARSKREGTEHNERTQCAKCVRH